MIKLTEREQDRVRNLILMESNPVSEWIAKRLPLGIVRTVLILAARSTGEVGKLRAERVCLSA